MNESIRSAPIRSSPQQPFVHHPYDMKLQQSMTMHHQQSVTAKKVPHTMKDNSMALSMNYDELDFYRHRCQELEHHLSTMQGEFDHQRSVLGDSKIDSFIRENSTLHLDNEKLAKFAHQRKTEAELWKQKYESQLQQVIQIKANYELEIRQLSAEVQRLVARVEEFEFDKQRQISDVTSKMDDTSHKHLESIRRSHNHQSDLLEQQVRKLREQLEDQNLEIDGLQAKLLRLKNDDDEEMKRLLKDNETLRIRINQLEVERQEEIENLAQNLTDFQKQQLMTLKQAHHSQNDVIEGEVSKLRGLLEVKNTEIETLLQQNQRNKLVLKDEAEQLRSELSLLKQKLLEQERQSRRNLEVLQDQLTATHEDNLMYLRHNFENQLSTLDREIGDLKRNIDKKAVEIQVLLEEKSELRDFLESQIADLRRELEDEKIHKFEIEREKNREIDDLQEQFQRAQAMASEHSDQNVGQINFLEGEISRLKELLGTKSRDHDSHVNQSLAQKRHLDEEVKRLKLEIDRVRDNHQQLEHSKNNEIEELRLRNSKLESLYREKTRNADSSQEHNNLEIKRLKEQVDVKSQEIDNLLVQRSGFERECRRVRDENEELKTRLIQNDRERLQHQDELKLKLDSSAQFEINQLKAAFNTQLRVLQDENNTLKQSLENRDRDVTDLLQKCDQLSKSFDQGGPLGPESTTNKRICEVLLKSKSQRPSIQRSLG